MYSQQFRSLSTRVRRLNGYVLFAYILGIQANRVAGCVCHVGNPEHRRKLIEFVLKHFGQIDILFHNAGVNPSMGGILEVTESQFDKIMDTNIRSAFFLTRIAAPFMKP